MNVKPKAELVDCAEALRKISFSDPTALFEELIERGHDFYEELDASPKCNPTLKSALYQRIKRAERILADKKRLEAVS